MEIHRWMVGYTSQTEWIDRRGIFLWIAFYTGGLGGGLYLVSLYFNSLWGMLLSWLIIAVIKGGAHMIFLGKPLRFWRIVFRPGSSWLSRGIIFVLSFVLFGAVQMALTYWLPGTAAETVFKVLAGLAAFGVTLYTGFVLNTIKGVPFWNSALLPLLFVLYGFMGGFGLAVVIALNGGGIDLAAAETGSRWLLIANALLVTVYLLAAAGREATGRQSVREQMRGHLAPIFWIGVVALGIIIPLAIGLASAFSEDVSAGWLVAGVACEMAGGLALRYCILKAGAYKPLVARRAQNFKVSL
jgi:formate-dependent nitrite reductase membrane component NrfD